MSFTQLVALSVTPALERVPNILTLLICLIVCEPQALKENASDNIKISLIKNLLPILASRYLLR